MDRAFNFFDHPSLLRHSPNGNNPQTSSPSILPHAALLQQQQQQQQQQQHQSSNHQAHQQPSQTHQPSPFQHQQSQHPRQSPSQQQSLHVQRQHHQQQTHQQASHHHQQAQQHSQHPHLQQHPQLSHHPQHQQTSAPQQTHEQQATHPHASVQHHQMQQQLQLQPMETHHQDPVTASHHSSSQQGQRHQSRHSQSLASQHSQAHQFQMHHLQHQPQQQAQSHAQQGHGQHAQSASSHQQHQMSSLHLSQNQSQIGSLGLSTTGTNNSFPGTSGLPQSSSQFGQPLGRETQQQTQFQLQSQSNMSQPGMGPSANTNNSFTGGQPLQMQPLLSNQQPAQASFGSLNLPSSMLQGGVVDDPAGSSHHFGNSQSGDALSGPYPWDPAQPQGGIGSQTFAGTQNQQQPLLPLPLVGDTRASNSVNAAPPNSAFGNHNGGGAPNAFGGTLNSGMGALGSSLNNTVVSGLVNGGSIGGNVGATMSASGPDLSQRNHSISATDGASRTGKAVKKTRTAVPRKSSTNRGRARAVQQAARAPITSPVSNATLPNLKQQQAITAGTNPAAIVPSRGGRVMRGGKVKGRGRSRGDEEEGQPMTVTASTSGGSAAHSVSRVDSAQGATNTVAVTNSAPPQSQYASAKNANTNPTWTSKKPSSSRSKGRRKDGTPTTTVPVHLRNPKKGRARVFRECKQCRSENHIRRADCLQCKAPLPAGKRRRDGNPSYDRKNTTSSAVPNTHVVTQQLGASRPGMKEAVSSVISK